MKAVPEPKKDLRIGGTMYKLSRFNVRFERLPGSFLWNTLTGALIKLDYNAKHWMDNFDGTDDTSTYFKILLDNGCIVPDVYDELGKVLFDEKAVLLNERPTVISHIIAPGLGCNYSCPYCFERGHAADPPMDRTMQDEVCDFIIAGAERDDRLEALGITWFGGEPLLYLDAIEHMSSRLIAYCEERGVSYRARIVTNGRLLTAEAAEILAGCKVADAQISVDGTGGAYERSKGARPGDFEAVVSNIEACADMIHITVRINVADDGASALELSRHLLSERTLDGRIKVYAAHVRDYTGHTAEDEEHASHEAFLSFSHRFMAQFGEGGPYSAESLMPLSPARRCTACQSICAPNFCIGPGGKLWRCEHHLGRDELSVGSVADGRSYTGVDQAYLLHRHREECLRCAFLPVCLGGCPNDGAVLACRSFQESLIDNLMFGRE